MAQLDFLPLMRHPDDRVFTSGWRYLACTIVSLRARSLAAPRFARPRLKPEVYKTAALGITHAKEFKLSHYKTSAL
jgi:hypothetical protein